jgi:hypothetical protein
MIGRSDQFDDVPFPGKILAVASLDRQTNSLDALRSRHDAVERHDRVIGHLELALPTAAA